MNLLQLNGISKNQIDILENVLDHDVLELLLTDQTTKEHIIWATDDYASLGDSYLCMSPITVDLITGQNGNVIRPRVEKDVDERTQRSKEKAEVFTPSWICNKQNNDVDNAWFGRKSNRFNKEFGTKWESTYARKSETDTRDRIRFPKGKTWKDYVLAKRLEISCGEAPYLTSRYDTVTGRFISPKNRIGLLDRKLRVVTENTMSKDEWLYWAEKALQSVYGYEWQGDNVILARENVYYAIIEYYNAVYGEIPDRPLLLRFAEIISWNIWQMDGIKFVVPLSCYHKYQITSTLVGVDWVETKIPLECQGCKTGKIDKHIGDYSLIRDWETDEPLRFFDVYKGGK